MSRSRVEIPAALPGTAEAALHDSCDNPNVAQIITTQNARESRLIRLVFSIFLISALAASVAAGHNEGILFVIFMTIILMAMPFLITFKLLDVFVLRRMRSACLERCINVMHAEMARTMTAQLLRYWTTPSPALIGLDASRKLLFVQGENTGYRSLVLSPHQILDAKVERNRTVITDTTHRASPWLGLSPELTMLGLVSAGRSSSISTNIEDVFLEITYALTPSDPPHRLVFYFGSERRDADDWVLAIRRLNR